VALACAPEAEAELYATLKACLSRLDKVLLPLALLAAAGVHAAWCNCEWLSGGELLGFVLPAEAEQVTKPSRSSSRMAAPAAARGSIVAVAAIGLTSRPHQAEPAADGNQPAAHWQRAGVLAWLSRWRASAGCCRLAERRSSLHYLPRCCRLLLAVWARSLPGRSVGGRCQLLPCGNSTERVMIRLRFTPVAIGALPWCSTAAGERWPDTVLSSSAERLE
jgi:hypothetical protein